MRGFGKGRNGSPPAGSAVARVEDMARRRAEVEAEEKQRRRGEAEAEEKQTRREEAEAAAIQRQREKAKSASSFCQQRAHPNVIGLDPNNMSDGVDQWLRSKHVQLSPPAKQPLSCKVPLAKCRGLQKSAYGI